MSASIDDRSEDGEQRTVSMLAELSNEMVRLYKEQFGRGPMSARAAWAGPDILTVVLEGTLTPAERTWCGWASTNACARPACSSSTRACASSASRSNG
jgi:uncharacterized protein YbcI